MTTPGIGAPDGAYVVGSRYGQDVPRTEAGVMALVKGQTASPWQGAQNKFRVNGRALEEDLRLVNKHESEIGELVDAYRQLILQGEAQVFTKSGMYRKTEGCVSVEVIMISGGGGGGAGKWDIRGGNNQGGGHGGAGGGEIYAKIPAMLIPDEMLVEIHWDGGLGNGGVGSENPGTGGGTVKFGNVLTAVGGQGGLGSNGDRRLMAIGGTGLIPGGNGGGGWVFNSDDPSGPGQGPAKGSAGGNSTYAGELRGGGGGGGGGSPWAQLSWRGGTGAAFPGGEPGQDGMSPAQIIATGGGGGGGGTDARRNGGNGGWPGGGGGGGCGGTLASNNGNGGNGASGVVYIIERMT